jgi:hypothetical protein
MRPFTVLNKIRKLRHAWQADVLIRATYSGLTDADQWTVDIQGEYSTQIFMGMSLRDALDQALALEPRCGHTYVDDTGGSYECTLAPHRWNKDELHCCALEDGRLVKWMNFGPCGPALKVADLR